jgi:predicted nucleic acid-binding protein
VSRFVLDCSVAVAWFFEDETDVYADAVMDAAVAGGAIVPCLWHHEIANALIVAERRGRVTAAKSARYLSSLDALRIDLDSVPPAAGELLAVGRDFALSSYDAAYLHLAMREGLPLATRDRALEKAAATAGVERFAPPERP